MPSLIDENTQYIDPVTQTTINNGYIYIGAQNQDAKLNPITIYADRDLTVVLSNPQRTGSDGKSLNKIWVPGRYSMKVEDQNNVQKLNDLDLGELPQTGITALHSESGVNDIIASGTPVITSLKDKQTYIFTAPSSNTGAMTLKIDSTAVTPIKKFHDVDMESGDTELGQQIAVIYNQADSSFEVLSNTISSPQSFESYASLKSAPLTAGISLVNGRASPGDGGDGKFYFDPSSTQLDNGGTVLIPNSIVHPNPGRWIRLYRGLASVKWFGAVGDGVANDSSAVTSAISNCKGIYFPSGTYAINVAFTKNDLTIDGDKATLTAFANAKIMDIINSSNITIENITIDGTAQTGGDSTNGTGLNLNRVSYSTIRNISANNCGYYGVNPFECNYCTFENITMNDNWRHGIHPGADTLDYNIYNTYINLRLSGNGIGAAVSGASGVSDRGNSIDIAGSYGNVYIDIKSIGDRDGFFVFNQTNVNMSDIYVSGAFTSASLTNISYLNLTGLYSTGAATTGLLVNDTSRSNMTNVHIQSNNGDAITLTDTVNGKLSNFTIDQAMVGKQSLLIIDSASPDLGVIDIRDGTIDTVATNCIALQGDGAAFNGVVSVTGVQINKDSLLFFAGADYSNVDVRGNPGWLKTKFQGYHSGTTDSNGFISITYRSEPTSTVYNNSYPNSSNITYTVKNTSGANYTAVESSTSATTTSARIYNSSGSVVASTAVDVFYSVNL